MEGPDTDPLLRGLAAGDERSFEALYDRYAAAMYRVALKMLGAAEDAEDVVQEVFMAVARSRKSMAEVRDLQAYLFISLRRAAARCAARRARMLAVRRAAADLAPPPRQRSEPDDPRRRRLQRALLALPEAQRDTLALKIDGGLTFAQIGKVMDVGANTAASRYRYAMLKLKESLNGELHR
ncbi:MAG: RNA polymerase sigma factor [Pirellulales bacterium]|nr:RNA polymerase sigma factor [Pirellulales bacterium]